MSPPAESARGMRAIPVAALPEPEEVITLDGIPEPSPIEAFAILQAGDSILISDEFNHRLLRFDADGRMQHLVGSRGSSPGRFNYPRGIAASSDRVWVCDALNHRIQVFNASGGFLQEIPDGGEDTDLFFEPQDLVPYIDDMMLAGDRRNHRVVVLDRDGRRLATWGRRRAKQAPWRYLPFKGLLRPYPDHDAALDPHFRWDYLNQIALDRDRLWSADNKRLTVYGPLGQLLVDLELAPTVCRRGLTASGETAIFLDEASSNLAVISFDGRRALLQCEDGRLNGCGPAPGGGVYALAGERLLRWARSDLLAAAREAWNPSGEPAAACSAIRWHAAAGREDRASRRLASEFAIGEASSDTAKLAIRLSHLGHGREKLAGLVTGMSAEGLKGAAEEMADLFARWSAIDAPGEPRFRWVLHYFDLVPDPEVLLNTQYLNPAASDLAARIYGAAEKTALHHATWVAWDGALATGEPMPDGRAAAALAGEVGSCLLATALSASERRMEALENASLLLNRKNDANPPRLHELGNLKARLVISSQVLLCCASTLESILLRADPDELPERSELRLLRERLPGLGTGLPEQLATNPVSETTRPLFRLGYREAVLRPELLEQLGHSILETVRAREVYLESVFDRDCLRAYLLRCWRYLLLRERAAREDRVLLPALLPTTDERAHKLLERLGASEKLEELDYTPPEDEETELFKVRRRALVSALEELSPDIFSFAEGDQSVEQFSDRMLDFAGDDIDLIKKVILHLWPRVDTDDSLWLLTNALESPAVSSLDAKAKAPLRGLGIYLAVIAGRPEVVGAFIGDNGFNGDFKDRPEALAGVTLTAARRFTEALPLLRKCLAVTQLPERALAIREALCGMGAAADADRLWSQIRSGFDLRLKDLSAIQETQDRTDPDQLGELLVKHWHLLPLGDEGEKLELLRIMSASGLAGESEKLLRTWISERPWRWDLGLLLAQDLCRLGRYNESLQILRERVPRFGSSISDLSLARTCHISMGHYREALKTISKTRCRGQHKDFEYYFRAAILGRRGKHRKAARLLKKIHEIPPMELQASIQLGILEFSRFRLSEALERFRTLEFRNPNSLTLAQWQLLVLLKQRLLSEAERSLEQAAASGFKSPALDGLRAAFLSLHEHVAEARVLFQACLRREPWGYWGLLASLCYGDSFLKNPPDESDKEFVEALEKRFPRLASVHCLKALLTWAEDGPQAALDRLPEPVNTNTPESAFLSLVRGRLALAHGKAEDAAAALKPFIMRFGLEGVHLHYAEAMLRLGRTREAMRVLKPLRADLENNPLLQELTRSLDNHSGENPSA